VQDPFYGGPQGFERVLDLVEEASGGCSKTSVNGTSLVGNGLSLLHPTPLITSTESPTHSAVYPAQLWQGERAFRICATRRILVGAVAYTLMLAIHATGGSLPLLSELPRGNLLGNRASAKFRSRKPGFRHGPFSRQLGGQDPALGKYVPPGGYTDLGYRLYSPLERWQSG
jgi:hypothetical protein